MRFLSLGMILGVVLTTEGRSLGTHSRRCPPICNGSLALQIWEAGKSTQEQATKNSAIFLATLFPKKNCPVASSRSSPDTLQKASFLQRFFFLLSRRAVCKFQNGVKETPCGFPVALMLGQGGRILIEANGISSNQILNWLLSGNENQKGPFLKDRFAASHGITQNKEGRLQEVKLKGVRGTVQNVMHGLRGRHHYINISLGGVGNRAPLTWPCDQSKSRISNLKQNIQSKFSNLKGKFSSQKEQTISKPGRPSCPGQCLINEGGEVYDTITKKNANGVQHGHIYIFAQDFKNNKTAGLQGGLLIGLENSAPGKKNFWGITHNVKSAFADLSHSRAATGGNKLSSLLGEKAPLSLGGIVVLLNKEDFKNIQASFGSLPKTESRFKTLLQSPPSSSP